jgi:protein TonB
MDMKVVYCILLLLFIRVVSLGQDTTGKFKQDLYQNSRDTIGIVNQPDKPAVYPGGSSAWTQYLIRNLNAQQSINEMELTKIQQQTAIVQFVVCSDGTVCEVHVINDVLPSIKKEAERLIKRSRKWIPANQEGVEVKSYKQQSITFKNF